MWLENRVAAPCFLCPFYGIGRVRIIRMGEGNVAGKEGGNMFFGKKDKDVRLTDKEYKSLVGGMSKKERKDFDRRQKEFKREREDDRLDAWLDFEDDMDDMG